MDKKSIIELLGIKPIEREYNSLLDEECFYEDNIREVEEQRNEMLEALIKINKVFERDHYLDIPIEFQFLVNNTIEKACHPLKWPAIKELLNGQY